MDDGDSATSGRLVGTKRIPLRADAGQCSHSFLFISQLCYNMQSMYEAALTLVVLVQPCVTWSSMQPR